MWHRHKWKEVERFYAEPCAGHFKGESSAMLMQQLVMGVTTIRYECDCCTKSRTEEIVGKSMKEPNP